MPKLRKASYFIFRKTFTVQKSNKTLSIHETRRSATPEMQAAASQACDGDATEDGQPPEKIQRMIQRKVSDELLIIMLKREAEREKKASTISEP